LKHKVYFETDKHNIPETEHSIFMKWDMAYLKSFANPINSNSLTIIMCEGWENSEGCNEELEWAKEYNKNICDRVDKITIITDINDLITPLSESERCNKRYQEQ
jgi:hypothetical protein